MSLIEEDIRGMRAYYIMHCSSFNLPVNQEVKEDVSFDMFEESDATASTIIKNHGEYLNNINLIHVFHEMRIKQSGVIFVKDEVTFKKKVEFESYIHKAAFNCYYFIPRQLFVLRVSKHIRNDFAKRVKSKFSHILSINEKRIDFSRLPQYFNSLSRAYFKKMSSPEIKNAVIGGNIDPVSNNIYNQFKQSGEISAITLRYPFRNELHSIMLTQQSGIILFDKYESVDIELEIVRHIIDNLLVNIWI